MGQFTPRPDQELGDSILQQLINLEAEHEAGLRVRGVGFRVRAYLEGPGNLVSRLRTPRIHGLTLVILFIKPIYKLPLTLQVVPRAEDFGFTVLGPWQGPSRADTRLQKGFRV